MVLGFRSIFAAENREKQMPVREMLFHLSQLKLSIEPAKFAEFLKVFQRNFLNFFEILEVLTFLLFSLKN